MRLLSFNCCCCSPVDFAERNGQAMLLALFVAMCHHNIVQQNPTCVYPGDPGKWPPMLTVSLQEIYLGNLQYVHYSDLWYVYYSDKPSQVRFT